MNQVTDTPQTHIAPPFRDRLRAWFPPPSLDAPVNNVTAAVTFIVGYAIAAFLFWANGKMWPFEEYHLVNDICLLWVPVVVTMLFLKQKPEQMGLDAGNRSLGLKWVVIGYLVMLPVVVVVSHQGSFSQYYSTRLIQPLGISNWWPNGFAIPSPSPLSLFYYELVMGMYFFCWEFFFRGFMLFGLARGSKIGVWGAIILQTIPFTFMHWSYTAGAAKPSLETFGAALGGPALGYLAFRTRTFFYGFLIHWLMAGTLDVLVAWPLMRHH